MPRLKVWEYPRLRRKVAVALDGPMKSVLPVVIVGWLGICWKSSRYLDELRRSMLDSNAELAIHRFDSAT